jgi:hypothetical protein
MTRYALYREGIEDATVKGRCARVSCGIVRLFTLATFQERWGAPVEGCLSPTQFDFPCFQKPYPLRPLLRGKFFLHTPIIAGHELIYCYFLYDNRIK